MLGRLDVTKSLVTTSSTYRHDQFHQELVDALRDFHDGPTPPVRPERGLGDLRAALSLTLRLIERTPRPDGLTLLSVAFDCDVIDETPRLRDLAEW